jgi:hypothetical protein
MTLAEAMEYVANRVPINIYPVVSTSVLESLVSTTARHTSRANSTVYFIGDRIVPAVENGRVYKCVVPGTSNASAPIWPEAGEASTGQIIKDGTVEWMDHGPRYAESYDLNAAVRSVWLYKSGQAAMDIDATDGGLSYRSSQIQKQCLEMARRYVGLSVE